MATFGERLRFRRNRLGWTQEDLASKTGFSVSSITGWERGINPPNAQSLTKLAEVLTCDAGWLLIGSTPAAPEPQVDKLNEGAPGYAEDHISPPWIRDLIARLCSLSPAFRERAVREFHLTLDQMISGVDRRQRYLVSDIGSAIDPSIDNDPELVETLRAGVRMANQLAADRVAGRDEGSMSGKPAPGPKSAPSISRQSGPAKPAPMKTS